MRKYQPTSLSLTLQNNSLIFLSLNPLCGWLLSVIKRQIQTAELFNFAKWLLLSLLFMVELCKCTCTEIQGSNKCQVNSNYPTNIWHFVYFSCEQENHFWRVAVFREDEVKKMHNNNCNGLDRALIF